MKAAAQATEEENIKENENSVPVFPGTNSINMEKQFPTRPDPGATGLTGITLFFVHREPGRLQGCTAAGGWVHAI